MSSDYPTAPGTWKKTVIVMRDGSRLETAWIRTAAPSPRVGGERPVRATGQPETDDPAVMPPAKIPVTGTAAAPGASDG